MLTALLLAASLCVPARAQAPPPAEARLDALLADILGPGRARAFVRLVPLPADVVEPEAKADAPAVLWDAIRKELDSAPPVLPGFRAPRTLREEALRQLMRQAAPPKRREPASPGSALSVTLIADTGVSEAELSAAVDAVSRALELSYERGDTLRTSRAPLAPTLEKSLREPMTRAAAAAGGMAGLGTLLGLLVVALAVRARGGDAPPQVHIAQPPAPHIHIAQPSQRAAEAAPAPPPTLSHEDPPDLTLPPLGTGAAGTAADLLRDGPGPLAAWLLGAASPGEAAAVYARLNAQARQAVAVELAGAAEPFPERPETRAELAGRLRERVAGIERLEEIVQRCGPRLRAEAAGALRLASPSAASRLSALPLFPELCVADREDLRLALSPFSTPRLAAALSGEPEEVRAAFLDALPQVAADLLRERLEEGSVSPDSPAAQGEILARWTRLERQGRVRPVSASVR